MALKSFLTRCFDHFLALRAESGMPSVIVVFESISRISIFIFFFLWA